MLEGDIEQLNLLKPAKVREREREEEEGKRLAQGDRQSVTRR